MVWYRRKKEPQSRFPILCPILTLTTSPLPRFMLSQGTCYQSKQQFYFNQTPSTLRRRNLRKGTLISKVRPTVHTIPPRNRSVSKTLFEPDGKYFEKEGVRKSMTSRQSRDLPARVFLKRKSKMAGDCCVFKFLQRSVNGKHLMCFQSETFVFKFLQRSVDGKHLMRFQSETSVFKFPRRNVDRWGVQGLKMLESLPTREEILLIGIYWAMFSPSPQFAVPKPNLR